MDDIWYSFIYEKIKSNSSRYINMDFIMTMIVKILGFGNCLLRSFSSFLFQEHASFLF